MLKSFVVLGLALTMLFLMGSTVMADGNSWGAGIGIPFGGLAGVNLDTNIIGPVDLSLSVGINLSGLGYDIGAKVYLAPEDAKFRPRLSYYYGTNTVVVIQDFWGNIVDSDSYNGYTVGVGGSITFGRSRQNGVDFDLLYIVSTEADIEQLEAEGYDTSGMNGIKISVGYRRRF